jgi:hypothetical protein
MGMRFAIKMGVDPLFTSLFLISYQFYTCRNQRKSRSSGIVDLEKKKKLMLKREKI